MKHVLLWGLYVPGKQSISREVVSVRCYVTLSSFSKSFVPGTPLGGLQQGLLPSSKPDTCSSSLCKSEQKTFTWVSFQLFPHLPLQTKPYYSGFLDRLNIFNELNHQPHTAPRLVQRPPHGLWATAFPEEGERKTCLTRGQRGNPGVEQKPTT